jgi:hypothetical protein
MKTTALSLGKWILLGVILAVLGALALVGRRRGTALYRWRIGLWAFALTLMGSGMVLASPSVKSRDAASFDNSGAVDQPQADEVVPECYKPIVMCYKQLPDPPPQDPPDDGAPTDDGDDDDEGDKPVVTDPPVVMPTCYAPMPPPPPPPPTCYAPMPTCYEPMPVDLPEEPGS